MVQGLSKESIQHFPFEDFRHFLDQTFLFSWFQKMVVLFQNLVYPLCVCVRVRVREVCFFLRKAC